VLAGNWLEKKALQKTTSSIGELNALKNKKVRVLLASGTIIVVDQSEISVGDILVANEGDRIGADGTIIKGSCAVDESLLTGESLSLDKSVGDFVIGGSTIVSGTIHFRVDTTDSKSFLSSIINLVKQAQHHKPNIQKLSDQISAIFIPLVLSISLITFLLSFFVFDIDLQAAIMNSIAVLVISCPCAMGLATPTAVMVGVGKLAKNGILIKGGDTLEKLSETKIIVFDKTGTLTTGNFLIGEKLFPQENSNYYLGIIIALEKFSSHPIAQFLSQEMVKMEYIPFNDFKKVEEIKGIGLFGEDFSENHYVLGSHKILKTQSPELQDYNIFLLKNEILVAALQIDDVLREEAKQTINFLKEKGLDIHILSGDKYSRVEKAAQQLGLEHFYSEQSPSGKVDTIRQLSKKGITVMVGDGINDSGALSAADLGVSLSNASQVAMDSAQIIFLTNHFNSFKKAFEISDKTILTIKQNLFWAFSYNLVAIPLAAMGYLNPMWGAIFMAFSDLVVIGNSIRLNLKKI
jgi:Cu+-exporting ATPase